MGRGTGDCPHTRCSVSSGGSLRVPLHLPATLDLYKTHNSTLTWDHVYTFINGTSHQLLRSFQGRVSVSRGDFTLQGVRSGDGGVYMFQDLDATCLAWLHLTVLGRCSPLSLVVPAARVAVVPGGTALLPAALRLPAPPPPFFQVRWRFLPTGRLVLLLAAQDCGGAAPWRLSCRLDLEQGRGYEGRVGLGPHDASLLLRDARPADAGTYRVSLLGLDVQASAEVNLTLAPAPTPAAAPSARPLLHRFVAWGSTAAIPLRLPRGSVALCKVNARGPRCDWVVVLIRGRLFYFLRAFTGHLILHASGLVVQEMKGDMEGEYWVLSGQNRTCLARILLTAVGGRKPAEMAGKDSELEKGLHAIVGSFYKYAKGPPGAKALDQAAFQKLLSNELSHQLTDVQSTEAGKDLLKKLDTDNNQLISFEEYWELVAFICYTIQRYSYSK
ncbi:staphylococcal nuclease domain-containing protein 1 [Platysternon megacephalum]|uniref:Staphylococcal nuclease domain-containing protein 1 n=1 Tax=Platysternon megacephalum TaxID=55544 RepID=A0A4D9DHJ0_9SAUR|nr:staphylococcal nuclease domain-containing protein 1 [Platysternon megacephalum]